VLADNFLKVETVLLPQIRRMLSVSCISPCILPPSHAH
jgi:hypothetical protein